MRYEVVVRTKTELAHLSSEEIVELVIREPNNVKNAAVVLEERPSDPRSGDVLIAAYRSERAPAWLTAVLLGRLRTGYEVAREILLRNAGSLSESYAGVAMGRIDPLRAHEDLRDAIFHAESKASREGAAYGLGWLSDVALIPIVVDAVRANRIRRRTGGFVIAELGSPADLLIAWLADRDPMLCALAVDAVAHGWASESGREDQALARAMRAVIEEKRVKLAPSTRRALEERIAQALNEE